jgi:hypothetical protein
LTRLREGLQGDPSPIASLAKSACESHDQAIQKASLAGLAQYGTSEAVLVVARRLLDSWGVGAITRCIHICGNLPDQGGLILLSATLFYDDRFIRRRSM